MQRVYSLLVDNTPGVLSRISGLFSRRGYSIDSITAGVTADPRFTRITIVASGDELILSQIEKQVRKLEDVIEIKVLKEGESVYRELIMVKVRANAAQRAEIIAVADIFRAKVVDVEKESLILELTGASPNWRHSWICWTATRSWSLPGRESPVCPEESGTSRALTTTGTHGRGLRRTAGKKTAKG